MTTYPNPPHRPHLCDSWSSHSKSKVTQSLNMVNTSPSSMSIWPLPPRNPTDMSNGLRFSTASPMLASTERAHQESPSTATCARLGITQLVSATTPSYQAGMPPMPSPPTMSGSEQAQNNMTNRGRGRISRGTGNNCSHGCRHGRGRAN